MNKSKAQYWLGFDHSEYLEHGCYDSKELAEQAAYELRDSLEPRPESFQISEAIPSKEVAQKYVSELSAAMLEFASEWLNENVETAGPDGFVDNINSDLSKFMIGHTMVNILQKEAEYSQSLTANRFMDSDFEQRPILKNSN